MTFIIMEYIDVLSGIKYYVMFTLREQLQKSKYGGRLSVEHSRLLLRSLRFRSS